MNNNRSLPNSGDIVNVLLLGPMREHIVRMFEQSGDTVFQTEERLTPESDLVQNVDFLVSYGYRHIIRPNMIERFPDAIINLHISLLPWNRGSDPNLWSFLEDTPKGVTLHLVDEGLDTGHTLFQREVTMLEEDSLRTSYARLTDAIEALLEETWPLIRLGKTTPIPQPTEGTSHRLQDKEQFIHLLTKSWDTPVRELIGRARSA